MPRIDAVEIYRVRLPLVYPFRTAYGSDDAVGPVLVKLVSGRFHGWGEAQAFLFPTYCPEYSAGVFGAIKNVLAPAIAGRQIDTSDSCRSGLQPRSEARSGLRPRSEGRSGLRPRSTGSVGAASSRDSNVGAACPGPSKVEDSRDPKVRGTGSQQRSDFDPTTAGEALQQTMACFKGNFFAKGAVDMAWWDLLARTRGEPLWKTLGGQGPDVEVGADFGAMETIDALLGKIGQALDAGFKRVKLKYAPGWDLPVIKAVRGAFPDAVFHIDCNSGYTLADLDMFKQLDRYNLAMIEQPLMHDDLVDHATLQKHIRTPICLDESATSPDKVRKAIEIGACRWVNIKPVRVGGHTPALKIHNLCRDAGVGCWVGGMLESGIGAAHCLAAATLPNIKYPSDVFPSSRFFHKDLSVPDWHLTGPSKMTALDAPGIGCDPNPEMLEKCTIEKTVI